VKAAGELGLKAFTESDHIRVKWDLNTALFASNATGFLVVKDGWFQNVIPLDSLVLRQGTLTYFPLTALVNFELQVGDASDFIAVTGISEKTRLSAAGKTVSPHASPSIANSIKRPLPKTLHEIDKLATAQMPDRLATERLGSNPETSPLHPTPIKISEFTAPPNLNPAPPPVSSYRPQLPAPAIPGPFVLPEPRERILYLAPQSVKRVSPKAPANITRLLVSPLTIRVKINVDTDGQVMRAESLSRGSALLKYLSILSVDAARKWVFRPAQQGDHAVESETVLEFSFGPNGS